jgi:hypothetical protein
MINLSVIHPSYSCPSKATEDFLIGLVFPEQHEENESKYDNKGNRHTECNGGWGPDLSLIHL